MDSQDKYFEATQTVYEWWVFATQLLAAYIFYLMSTMRRDPPRKTFSIKVLDDGITKS
ncbi:hemolysin E [Escherichia coli]